MLFISTVAEIPSLKVQRKYMSVHVSEAHAQGEKGAVCSFVLMAPVLALLSCPHPFSPQSAKAPLRLPVEVTERSPPLQLVNQPRLLHILFPQHTSKPARVQPKPLVSRRSKENYNQPAGDRSASDGLGSTNSQFIPTQSSPS